MSGQGSSAATGVCANCGAALAGAYCSQCGQRDREVTRTPVRELVGQWLGDVFTFDSRVLRTLWPLVRRPGFLTGEYLAGRRVRYVPPLRLFVFLSIVMFLVMGLTGVRFSWHATGAGGEVVAAYDGNQPATGAEPSTGSRGAPPADDPAVGEPLTDVDEINRRLIDSMSQTMILLVPVMAFWVWLLHRRRSPYYAAHLIFALHVHSFWFLVMSVAGVLDLLFRPAQPGKVLILVTWLPYLLLAQRRVYGGGWWANLGRTAVLMIGQAIGFFAIVWVLLMRTVFGG